VNYQRYSSQFKEAILNKLNQSGLSVRRFAEQEGINLSTLYSWQKQCNTSGLSVTKVSSPDKWSSEEKFSVVMETATLSEVELSEYCRIKGLYSEQVKAWKQACITVNTTAKPTKRAKVTPEQKSDKKRIKELEREVRRKDKTLGKIMHSWSATP
jgi:transposase